VRSHKFLYAPTIRVVEHRVNVMSARRDHRNISALRNVRDVPLARLVLLACCHDVSDGVG
jgi:hypothetical protein